MLKDAGLFIFEDQNRFRLAYKLPEPMPVPERKTMDKFFRPKSTEKKAEDRQQAENFTVNRKSTILGR
jgi:hypothetical protein